MKVLHISTMDHGGAGLAALRLHRGLRSAGVASRMLVLRRSSSDRTVARLGERDKMRPGRADKERIDDFLFGLKACNGIQAGRQDLFSLTGAIYNVGAHALLGEADVIHLHLISQMVDYREFFPKISGKPVVWTLHDMNPFTGGCHYAYDCHRYRTGCGMCPRLGSRDSGDLSRRIITLKKALYPRRLMRVVGSSRWIVNCARRSLLFRDLPVDRVGYGLRTDIFRNRNKRDSRKLLNLPRDKTLILFGSDYRTKRKGFAFLVKALLLLRKKTGLSSAALVTFGPPQDTGDLCGAGNFPVYQLGYIRDEALLSRVYSSADIFVAPSLAEAFNQTCLEAMLCRTPSLPLLREASPI